MKPSIYFTCALILAAVLPASTFAVPNAYNFGWTTSSADMVKPSQVFGDSQYIYVQFDDPAHVPVVFTKTSNGAALPNWYCSYPYIATSYQTSVLIFRTGDQEAWATGWYVDGMLQTVLCGAAAPVKTTDVTASRNQ